MQVRPTADGNSVDLEYEASNEKLDRWADTHGAPAIIVATGFIAKDPKVRPGELCRSRCSGDVVIWAAM